MIKIAERKKMKKVFKNRYANDVLERLNENKIVSKKGLPFSISYITHVFNGRNENSEIERVIIDLYKEKVAEVNEVTKERKEIFTNKKPEAGTSGLIQ